MQKLPNTIYIAESYFGIGLSIQFERNRESDIKFTKADLYIEGFRAGIIAEKRKRNTSGCCCIFSDDDTEITRLCEAHKSIINKAVEGKIS